MKLPNAHRAVIEPEKITDYLLSITSPRGRSKVRFFLRFGFSADNWQAFDEALRLQGAANEVVSIVDTAHGLRYRVDGIIETPDGRNPRIRTVWQINTGTDYPRLLTARPLTPRRRRNDA